MTSAPCNLCGSLERRELFRKAGAVIVQCLSCGLGFMDPRPSAADLERFYREQYRRKSPPTPGKERAKLREARALVRAVRRILPRLSHPVRLLDVGCSFGYLLAEARRVGWEARGIDISDWQVEFARSRYGVDASVCDFPGSGLPSGRYDVITLLEVIEHVPDPSAALGEIRELLAPGGLLVVRVPDFGHPRALREGPRWRGAVVPDHLYYFSARTLREMAARKGLCWRGEFLRPPWREMLKAVFRKSDPADAKHAASPEAVR